MGRAARTLAVALLLVLAGCAGSNPGTLDAGQEGAETTAPEPTESPTRTASELPPGVTEGGVEDAWALADAHAEALRDQPYTVSTGTTSWYDNGTLGVQSAVVTHVGPERRSYRSVQRIRGGSDLLGVGWAERDAWSNGTESLTRIERRNGSAEYRRGTGTALRNPTGRDTLYGIYATHDLRVAGEVERNGSTLVRLVTADVRADAVEGDGDETAVILVDADGLVHEYHLSSLIRAQNETFYTDRSVRFANVGSADVPRPAWAGEARNETA